MQIIDSYTHYTPPNYLKDLAKSSSQESRNVAQRMQGICEASPNFVNLERRIEHLDRHNIASQVTMVHNSIEPNMFPLQEQEEVSFCKLINNDIANLVNSSKGRIYGLATVPFDSLEEEGLDEMRRAIQDLGLRGFMVLTNIHGKPIDQFATFWNLAAKLGTPVWLHPSNPASTQGRPYEDEFDLVHVMGWPFETSLALARIVFTGLPQKYPRLRIISHHLGGMIPFYMGRIAESYDRKSTFVNVDQAMSVQQSSSVTEYFKQFYYDTAVGGNKAAVRCGYEVFGAERVLFSTDYPWGPEGGQARLRTYPQVIRSIGISPEEQELIFEGNIRSILGI